MERGGEGEMGGDWGEAGREGERERRIKPVSYALAYLRACVRACALHCPALRLANTRVQAPKKRHRCVDTSGTCAGTHSVA